MDMYLLNCYFEGKKLYTGHYLYTSFYLDILYFCLAFLRKMDMASLCYIITKSKQKQIHIIKMVLVGQKKHTYKILAQKITFNQEPSLSIAAGSPARSWECTEQEN